MAVSGLALFGFIVGHLAGNLQIFLGQEKINAYAAFLKSYPGALWAARIGLLVMAVIHVWAAVKLALENRAARPVAYAGHKFRKATYASRTMHYSGFIVLAYIVYHLMHFTFGGAHAQYFHLQDAQGRHDVYSMMVLSFQQPAITIAYIIAMLLLGWHLSHGLSSLFQTVGLNNDRLRRRLSWGGSLVAWAIFLGYSAIPLGVWLGFVKLPPGVTP